CIAYGDQAQDLVGVEVNHGHRVGIVKRYVANVVHGIDRDRVRPRTNDGSTGHFNRQPKVNRLHHLVRGRVDHRDAVAIGIGDQEVLPVQRHTRRVQTDRDAAGDAERGQVHHGNGAAGRGTSRIGGYDRGAVRVFLEVLLGSNSSGLVGDIRGGTI